MSKLEQRLWPFILCVVLLFVFSYGGSSRPQRTSDTVVNVKTPRYEIVSATLVTDEPIEAKSIIEKLPNRLRPADTSSIKSVIFRIKITSASPELLEIKSSEFALSYKADGKENTAPCVGLSFGDYWGIAEKGEDSVFVRANPSAEEKLLFLLPANMNEATLLYKPPSGESVVVKQFRSLSKG